MVASGSSGADGAARRVWLVLPSFRGGGAERVMVTLANAWCADGHDVTVVVARGEGPFRTELDPHVDILDFGVGRVLAMLLPLARRLRDDAPDAVLSTLTHTNVVVALAHRLACSRARLVLREANLPPPAEGPADRVLAALVPLAYRRAAALIAVSQAVADSLRDDRHVPERVPIEVIDNPAVTADLDRRAAEAMPMELNDESRPLVLAVGRLVAVKGFDILLEAFAQLDRARSVRLMILGEGPLRPVLEQQIAELGLERDVALPGFVVNPFAVMRAARVFVLSSHQEGSPNALVQAIALGCEAVATRIDGVTDRILEDGRFGRLVPCNDAGALATALTAALDTPLAPDRTAFRERFDSRAIVARYATLLELSSDVRDSPSDSSVYNA